MKTGVLAITAGGKELAGRIAAGLQKGSVLDCSSGVAATVGEAWPRFDGFVFVMAAGIVVRTIAPLIKDKRTDPCVVVCDERGEFAVSLLSGHLGGGNDLAEQVAALTGGRAVITTASDTLGLPAIDLWARDNNLRAEKGEDMARLAGLLVHRGTLRVFSDVPLENLPPEFVQVEKGGEADLVVSARTDWQAMNARFLRPRTLAVGIGCNRGAAAATMEEALNEALTQNNLSFFSIDCLASIDLKADEEGLLEYARAKDLPLRFFPGEYLNKVPGPRRSAAVFRATGAYAVAEPAAILASGGGRLLVNKMKWKDVTIAIAEKKP